MEKIGLFLILTLGLYADMTALKKNCLSCHEAQQIPSELIYRRYLMEYSTASRMADAMLDYLHDPKTTSSIMPPQFFLKFPMKEKLTSDEESLKANVKLFIQHFDIKNKLILEQ